MEPSDIQRQLSESIQMNWDADDSFELDYVWASPLGVLVHSLSSRNNAVNSLALIALEQSGDLWEIMGRTDEWASVLKTGRQLIVRNSSSRRAGKDFECIGKLREFEPSHVNPVLVGAAISSLENFRELIATGDEIHAVYLMSNLAIAYEHSPLYERFSFREWLIREAVVRAWNAGVVSSKECEAL